MKTKQSLPLAAALFLSISLSACGGALYEAETWTPPNEEADWDIASLVCEDRAINHKMEDEKEEGEEGDDESEEVAAESEEGEDEEEEKESQPIFWGGDSDELVTAAAVIGAVGAVAKSSAEKSARNKVFSECMTERGWTVKE